MLKKVQELAKRIYNLAEQKTRDNKEEFWVIDYYDHADKDKIQDILFKAHDDMLPDDYKYEFIVDALCAICDIDAQEYDTEDDFRDQLLEQVEADICNGSLLKWLASNLQRIGYCDEYLSEFSPSLGEGIMPIIAGGQYLEKTEVYSSIFDSLCEWAKED